MYYKLVQACFTNWGSFVLLQIRANVATNRGSFIITNWGKCCYKLGQLLQIRATVITKQGSYYKLGQNVLQIGAGITNQDNYYKLGHTIYLHRYILGQYNLKYFLYPASLSYVSHSINICSVAFKNIRDIHAVSTNQHFGF